MVLTKAISFFGGMFARPLIGWLRLTSLLADIQIILLLLSNTFAFVRWSYLRSWQVNLTGGLQPVHIWSTRFVQVSSLGLIRL